MQRISKVFTLMGTILALAFCLASCKANVDEPTMYTVTVSSSIEHGKVSVDKTSAEAGATVKLTATADEGYELDSYSVKDASANELTVTDGTFTMPKSNVTVTATFAAVTYTVTFNSNGGSDVESQTVASGSKATEPAEPTKTATTTTKYTFDGWYSDSGLTTPFSFDTAIKKDITLYAKWTETAVTSQKTAGSISYATTTVSKTTADEAFTNDLTKTGDGTVTYASSKTDVAEVNTQTGLVTIKGAGETTITATVADSESYTYAVKTASYTLTITQAAASISYATTAVKKTTDSTAFTNTLNNTGDGTVTYASSKTAVAEVNATTGLVTIKGAGETTITATVADSDNYTYATKTASYTLTVTQASSLNLNLKTGADIYSILVQLSGSGSYPECTKFARSATNNDKATLYLDTEGKYIPVWSEGTEVYYYVPDGCTPVMNEDSSGMFAYCYKLTSLDVTGFDTSNVTNMYCMFLGCSGLTSLDVTGFDTREVTNMSAMFSNCSKLTGLDVTGFDTRKVTNMKSMFSGCSALESLDVSKFDTSKVENMEGMFKRCSKLTSLDVDGFNTSKVTNMSSMFLHCSGLTSLDVTGFDTSIVTDMSVMFAGCSGLTSLDVTGFDTSKVTNMQEMFSICSGLTSLDLSNFNTSTVSNMWSMFSDCKGLTTIYVTGKFVTTSLPDDDENCKSKCFDSCSKLVGGAGTTYDSSRTSADYARIDGGNSAPGYFTLKTIGSKSKPDAVGDIVFSDGSATPYTADLTLTEEEKAAAVAVIYYAGSASDTLGAKTLGVGLKNTGADNYLAWAKNGVNGYGTNITAIQCTPGSDNAATAGFTDDTDGSDNWQDLCDAVSDEGTSGNYPAWEWVNAYATTAKLTGDYASGWYLPTVAELSMLYCAKNTVNSALEKAGGTEIADDRYWSSSQYASDYGAAWDVRFEDGDLDYNDLTNFRLVCTVRAF